VIRAIRSITIRALLDFNDLGSRHHVRGFWLVSWDEGQRFDVICKSTRFKLKRLSQTRSTHEEPCVEEQQSKRQIIRIVIAKCVSCPACWRSSFPSRSRRVTVLHAAPTRFMPAVSYGALYWAWTSTIHRSVPSRVKFSRKYKVELIVWYSSRIL